MMFATAVTLAGPRPRRNAAMVAPSRYTMTRLVKAKYGYITAATPVHAIEVASAPPWRRQLISRGPTDASFAGSFRGDSRRAMMDRSKPRAERTNLVAVDGLI